MKIDDSSSFAAILANGFGALPPSNAMELTSKAGARLALR